MIYGYSVIMTISTVGLAIQAFLGETAVYLAGAFVVMVGLSYWLIGILKRAIKRRNAHNYYAISKRLRESEIGFSSVVADEDNCSITVFSDEYRNLMKCNFELAKEFRREDKIFKYKHKLVR